MTDKIPEKKSVRTAARRASSRSFPRGPHTELFLETTDGSTPDREALLDRLDRGVLGLRPVDRAGDEWLDETGRVRVLLGERVLVRLQLADEPRDVLSRRIDQVFDIAFELARVGELEVLDPQLGAPVTRFRFESQFPRILDAWFTQARTALSLASPEGWREVSKEGEAIALPTEAPAFEADPESLPPAVWSRRVRKVGALELRGERILGALAEIDPAQPWFAIVRPGARPGDDVALVRVLRRTDPVPGLAVIEAISIGLTRTTAIERTNQGVRVRF